MRVHEGRDGFDSEWVRARRRLRDELARIRRADCPLLAAHAALARLERYRHVLDWGDVRGRVLDAADASSGGPPRWPGDRRAARARGVAAEVGRWVGDVA